MERKETESYALIICNYPLFFNPSSFITIAKAQLFFVSYFFALFECRVNIYDRKELQLSTAIEGTTRRAQDLLSFQYRM